MSAVHMFDRLAEMRETMAAFSCEVESMASTLNKSSDAGIYLHRQLTESLRAFDEAIDLLEPTEDHTALGEKLVRSGKRS